MNNKEFAVFILSYGRADKVYTYKLLKKSGYSGRIYFIVSDDDEQKEKYIKNYGIDNVFIFNKDEMGQKYDTGDNFRDKKKVIFFARNYNIEIAKKLKLKYFFQFDDDYVELRYIFDKYGDYKILAVKSADKVFEKYVEFMEKNKRVTCIAFAQGGDLLGGASSDLVDKIKTKRKAMNTFLISTERDFNFVGRINEDVNTYVSMGQRGYIFMTFPQVVITQVTTQSNKNGMTETYLDGGTYLKSFYSVMYAPNCVKIGTMGEKHKRIHHNINWNNCCPCIISEKYKKGK